MEKIYAILIVLAVLILLYILWCLAEPFFLDSDKAVLKKSAKENLSDNDISVKKLPMVPDDVPGDPDFRFFMFSDVHAEWCPVTSKRICDELRHAHSDSPVDAVIFGGDIVSHAKNADKGYKYISEVAKCCDELSIPFYGITGNHDALITKAPDVPIYINMDNKATDIISARTGKKAILAGVSDSGTGKLEWPPMPEISGNEPVILLAHDPDYLLHVEKRPDYMLAGHLHGGQMKFPFKVEFRILRRKDKLPKKGAVQGIYDIGGTTVFISRGLGCGVMPFRFLSLPEVTVLEIHI